MNKKTKYALLGFKIGISVYLFALPLFFIFSFFSALLGNGLFTILLTPGILLISGIPGFLISFLIYGTIGSLIGLIVASKK